LFLCRSDTLFPPYQQRTLNPLQLELRPHSGSDRTSPGDATVAPTVIPSSVVYPNLTSPTSIPASTVTPSQQILSNLAEMQCPIFLQEISLPICVIGKPLSRSFKMGRFFLNFSQAVQRKQPPQARTKHER
jgi:hypothetical protein